MTQKEFEARMTKVLREASREWARAAYMEGDFPRWLAPRIADALEAALHWHGLLPVTLGVSEMSGAQRSALAEQQGRDAFLSTLGVRAPHEETR